MKQLSKLTVIAALESTINRRWKLKRTLMYLFVAVLAIAVAAPAAQAANLVTVNGKTFDLDQFSDAFVEYRADGSVTFDGKLWDNFVGVDPLTLGELAAGQFGSDPGDQISLNKRTTPDWLELNYPSGQTISSTTEFVVFEITSSSSGVDLEGLSWKIGFNGAAPVQVTLAEVSHFPSPGGGVEDTNMGVFDLVGDFGFSPGDVLYTVYIENVDSGSGTSDPDFIFGGVTFNPAPMLSCNFESGTFLAPFDKPIFFKGKKTNRNLPLKFSCVDEFGMEVDDVYMADQGWEAPVVEIDFLASGGSTDPGYEADLLPGGQATDGNSFIFNGDHWMLVLGLKAYTATGVYAISAVPGDGNYTMDVIMQTYEKK